MPFPPKGSTSSHGAMRSPRRTAGRQAVKKPAIQPAQQISAASAGSSITGARGPHRARRASITPPIRKTAFTSASRACTALMRLFCCFSPSMRASFNLSLGAQSARRRVFSRSRESPPGFADRRAAPPFRRWAKAWYTRAVPAGPHTPPKCLCAAAPAAGPAHRGLPIR